MILLSSCQQAGMKNDALISLRQGKLKPALLAYSNQDQGTGSNHIASDQEHKDVMGRLRSQHGLATTVEQTEDKAIVTNPDSILVVVNKERYLPVGYEPSDLVEPQVIFSFTGAHEKRHLRKEAAEALEGLFEQAKQDEITLHAVSGYRSYKRQQSLFDYYVQTKGQAYASRVSAFPGTSEHQTGLTMDLSSPSVDDVLEEKFADSTAGKWVAQHAHEFGFIIRYPKDKENMTGYVYEPWHVRYVGREAAQVVFENQLTLEQLLQ